MVGEKFVDDAQSLFAFLPADKGGEPAVDEEDFAVSFQIRQFRQSAFVLTFGAGTPVVKLGLVT